MKEGKERGSLRLEGFEKEVEVDGRRYVVKVIGGGAEFDKGRSGKKLLRIRITAEVGRVEGEHTIVDRVVREYTITFGRYGNNAVVGSPRRGPTPLTAGRQTPRDSRRLLRR